MPAPASKRQVGGDHYLNKSVQPWEAMESWMTPEQFRGYLRGCVIKYVARYEDKGGMLDLEKAQHYLDRLMEAYAQYDDREGTDQAPARPIGCSTLAHRGAKRRGTPTGKGK